jgi:hypothetical protein
MSLKTLRLHGLIAPAAVAGLLLGGVSASQAQVFFNYASTLTPVTYTNNGVTVQSDSASDSSGSLNAANTGTAVRGGGFRVNSAPTSNTHFTGTFLDTFTITDVASSQTGSITFDVNLGVTANSTQVIPGSTSVSISPAVSSITLGGNTFYVKFDNNDEVTPPGSNLFGSYSLQVQTLAPVGSVPEPGTVAMLVGLGISGTGLFLRNRRRTR